MMCPAWCQRKFVGTSQKLAVVNEQDGSHDPSMFFRPKVGCKLRSSMFGRNDETMVAILNPRTEELEVLTLQSWESMRCAVECNTSGIVQHTIADSD